MIDEAVIHIQGLRSASMEMYIRSSEVEFGLEHKDLKSMSYKELAEYVDFIDELHK